MEPVFLQNEKGQLCILHDYILPDDASHLQLDGTDKAVDIVFHDKTTARMFENVKRELEEILRAQETVLLVELDQEHEILAEKILPVAVVRDKSSSFFS